MTASEELLVASIWELAALAGLVYSIRNYLDALADRRYWRQSAENGANGVVVFGAIRRERVRIIFYVLALLLGLTVFVEEDHLLQLAVSFGLVMILGLNAYNSGADRRDRLAVRSKDGGR